MTQISRREFVARTACGAAAAPFAFSQRPAAASLTAMQIVDRIKASVGIDWRAETVDGFKAGTPETVITGIATTALATMEVLKKAVKAGANLVITCEPTFYARADTPTPPPRRGAGPTPAGPGASAATADGAGTDPVFAAKDRFIKTNNLVVWRFSDHWRLRRPDPFVQGLIDAFGWSRAAAADDPARVSIPEIALDALAAQVRKRLDARGGIRVVGDPRLRVRTIGLLPGSTPIQASLKALPGADVLIGGEVREWESVEYARDTVAAGGKKGLILLGRILSEEPGMRMCAQWLGKVVPELPGTWIAVGDPYWRPA